ncbi:HAD family phosphatase [Patescibacteria group bacterium]|nr:HAD family phosphatase [Patescibacteria group bacterium]
MIKKSKIKIPALPAGRQKSKLKAVIFDMDGLMLDTEPAMSASYEAVIKEYGKKPIFDSKTGLLHQVGLGKVIMNQILEKHNIKEDIEILRQKRRSYYLKIMEKKELLLMKGLTKIINLLKAKNIKLAVASNSNIGGIKRNLKKIKLNSFFEVLSSGEQVENYKPYPDIYLETAKRLNLAPSECLVLEDSESGVESGKAAGMKAIAVPSKYTKHQDFSKADLIVNSLEEITWEKIQKLFT